MNRLAGKAVLITGGTMGIGLATGLAFARQGAHCILTCKWGAADEDAILHRFRKEGLPEPAIVSADVANQDDTDALLRQIKERHDEVEAFVSNVSVALVVNSLEDYAERSLFKSIEYSAWPFYGYTRKIRQVFGKYPRYVVGLSSGGPDHFYKEL